MQGEHRERWQKLAEQVAEEQDPNRFTDLVAQLLAELDKKAERLKGPSKDNSGKAES